MLSIRLSSASRAAPVGSSARGLAGHEREKFLLVESNQVGISLRGSEFPERCQRPYSLLPFSGTRVEGTVGLLPYAARDVLRNRRRSISSILGVLLAVTLFAGTFIAIDSSARATLDASLAGIPGDLSFSIYTFGPNQVNYSTLEQAVLELGGVVNVSVYRNVAPLAFELRNSSGGYVGSYYVSQALAINPDRPPVLIRDSKVSGSLTLPRGSVGLSRDVATTLTVGLGDSVRAVDLSNSTLGTNLTVRALIDAALPTGFIGSPPPYDFYGGS